MNRSMVGRVCGRSRRGVLLGLVVLVVGAAGWGHFGHSARAAGASGWATPIRHVVVVYQENHSFDNVLGRWCVQTRRCSGATVGRLPGGATIPLRTASDIVPPVGHQSADQTLAVDGGRMDGFARILGCGASTGYACLTQFSPAQIPSLIALANQFVVSDATFEARAQPSWGSHLELVAGRQDAASSAITRSPPGRASSRRQGRVGVRLTRGRHVAPRGRCSQRSRYRACVPEPRDGFGSYPPLAGAIGCFERVVDRLQAAGLSWRIYAPAPKRPVERLPRLRVGDRPHLRRLPVHPSAHGTLVGTPSAG